MILASGTKIAPIWFANIRLPEHEANVEIHRFHDLRHTAASHMVMAGVPLKTVAEILGRATTAMTDRYSHLWPEHKLKAV